MAFLGIKVPHPTARLLSGIDVPGTKEGTAELHITILCFEENWPISEISKALESTYEVVSKIKPFLVTVDSVGCFPKRENKPCPIIAKVSSKELHDLNKKLRKKFDKDGIEYSKTFKDYKPHITLSYADKEIDEFKIDNMDFSVPEIVLWGGDHGDDRIFITFPLQGPVKQKRALLVQKANMFYKMAGNPPQDYLTPSFERRRYERLITAQETYYKYAQSGIDDYLSMFGHSYETAEEEFKNFGGWEKKLFKIIPISEVEQQDIWSQGKYDRALKHIQDGTPLDPVKLGRHVNGAEWAITDGIHRIAASKTLGYTHVPAVVGEWIKEPPSPNDPYFKNDPESEEDMVSEASANHYTYDPAIVTRWLEMFNNKDTSKEEYDEYGAWSRYSFKMVPISDIEKKPIWSQEKYDINLKKMQENIPLEPIKLTDNIDGKKLVITDGIHRVAASETLGYAYIPAIITEYIQEPPPK
jgi:2'-5' RNA ligase